MDKKDLRIIKTKIALFNALIELLKEKEFEEIKVNDICNKALVNRSTFYAHYQDKYELLESYIEDMKELLITELDKNHMVANSKEYYLQMINLILNHIEEKKDIYHAIMINNRNSIAMDIIYDVLDQNIIKKVRFNNVGNIPNDLVARFYLGAVFNVSIELLKSDNKYTKEQLIDYLDKLIPDDINS